MHESIVRVLGLTMQVPVIMHLKEPVSVMSCVRRPPTLLFGWLDPNHVLSVQVFSYEYVTLKSVPFVTVPCYPYFLCVCSVENHIELPPFIVIEARQAMVLLSGRLHGVSRRAYCGTDVPWCVGAVIRCWTTAFWFTVVARYCED